MNVFIISHIQGEGTPSATFVCDQAKAYVEQGAQVRMLIPVPWGKRDYFGRRLSSSVTTIEESGIRYYFLRYLSLSGYGERGFNAASAVRSLRRALDRILCDFRPDVIQAHTLGFDSTIGLWLKKRLSCPLVVTTHGSDTSNLYDAGRKELLRKYCQGADAVVCVSSKLRRQLADSGAKCPLHVIANGFAVGETDLSQPNGMDWIQVGNLIAQKHFDTTLRAFALFRKKYTDSCCRIVGRGPERERLESLCRNLGIAEAVQFVGQIENRHVLEEMARSRFYVMVSHPEGFGVVYLEAMNTGCIAIGTQGEGISDIIENGVNGFLVPPDDAEAVAAIALRCADDPALAEDISRKAKETARGLTWRANALKNMTLFEEILH